MIDLHEAQGRILQATPVLGQESVPITEALRRVLARDVAAVDDLPASDVSAVDGYAMRRTSLHGVSRRHPVHLRIIGEAPAGKPCGATVGDGEAVRIMTGGLVPEGADTVIKLEETTEDGGYVKCMAAPGHVSGIRSKGDSLKKGQIVLRAGDVISPLEIGALASMRRAYVYVHRKPMVAILSTGNELSDFHEPASPWKAMCSNLYALAAQVIEVGATPLCLGIVEDNLQAQQQILTEALRADLIVTSGGTSRGKYDLIHKTFASMGMEMRFSTIFVKPGKPTLFGTIGKRPVFGLPGNPSATMLSFDQFIRPALLKMMGHRNTLNAQWGRAASGHGNDGLLNIDSFNKQSGGDNTHHRATQVPLGKQLRHEVGHTIAEPKRFKIVVR
ncbi:gephyrin-like molybdotransferase Glp [uncultured Desulfosarcina sp.]|uniref:molybdopterin molybdotransferase MoeA n=1 Tax=uncultured Desulfosarcina sp. TaxID=218289 RepID=UPI0029C62E66|nr:gephyrin-like molybdotransferase Glp [uncultured Desulfosarcina sp.]